jgi:hypothetical protein
MRAGGLVAGDRVRPQPSTIEPKPVSRVGRDPVNRPLEHTGVVARERMTDAAVDDELDATASRGPDSDIDARWADEFDARGQATLRRTILNH